jgi:hypothetical protein
LSFFDDGEETAARPAGRAAPPQPRPRRPRSPGPGGVDRHTLMVRRRVAAGIAVVVVILIVLLVGACKKSAEQQSLKDYNHNVSVLASEFDQQVARPLFAELVGASGKSAVGVEVQVDQLRSQAEALAARAKGLSVPGDMVGAQRNLLTALNLRVEGLTKLAAVLPSALGGQGKQASAKIAGDMEIFLASDVLFSQRIVPLTQEALAAHGIHELSTTTSRMVPNIGWLEPNTVLARITGQNPSSSSAAVAPGTHGTALTGVSVGTTALEAEPTLNHISGGGSPTFTVTVEDTGSNAETNVKADVGVTAAGKQFKASHVINQIQPGSKVNVEIPVTGIPTGVAAKIEVNVEPVPGETETENNKASYLAIFSP